MVKKIRFALYDKSGYMSRLILYLCKKNYQMIESRLFTSLELLKDCAGKGEVDVLLAGEEVLEEVMELEDVIPQIMLLSEGEMLREESKYPLVFKYQPVPDIIREVLSEVADNDNIYYTQQNYRKSTAELIGVYAPFGGGGVTETALDLTKKSAKQRRTLYVNLELFQGLDFLFTKEKGKEKADMPCRGMSEVIFYLKQRKEKLALKLESLIFETEEIEGIATVEDYRDIYQMQTEDMQYFLNVLTNQTEYEKVIFDIGFFNETALYLMTQCEKILMPQAVTRIQQSKESAFRRLLLRENCGQTEQNIQIVQSV